MYSVEGETGAKRLETGWLDKLTGLLDRWSRWFRRSSAKETAGYQSQTEAKTMKTMKTIVIAGHSHGVALGMPGSSEDLKPQLIRLDDDGFEAMTGGDRDAAYWSALADVARNKDIAILWSGNEHVSYHLIEHTPKFDVVLPHDTGRPLDEGAVIVPYKALFDLYRLSYDPLDALIKNLQSVEGCRVFVIGTPPPRADDALIQAEITGKSELIRNICESFQIDIETARPAPRYLMRKLWSILQDASRHVAERNGAQFLDVPASVQTEDGFLRQEYTLGHDFTHANNLYGETMRQHIAMRISAVES